MPGLTLDYFDISISKKLNAVLFVFPLLWRYEGKKSARATPDRIVSVLRKLTTKLTRWWIVRQYFKNIFFFKNHIAQYVHRNNNIIGTLNRRFRSCKRMIVFLSKVNLGSKLNIFSTIFFVYVLVPYFIT